MDAGHFSPAIEAVVVNFLAHLKPMLAARSLGFKTGVVAGLAEEFE